MGNSGLESGRGLRWTKLLFLERLQSGDILVADGATGTNLQQHGLSIGKPGEVWVFECPQEIKRLHKDFVEAGSDIILTCTFGGASIHLDGKRMENEFLCTLETGAAFWAIHA